MKNTHYNILIIKYLTNTRPHDLAHKKTIPTHHRANLLHLLPKGRLQSSSLCVRILPVGLQPSECTSIAMPQSQKARLYYLFLSTWVVDFIWLIYWGVTWSSDEYQNSGESGSSTFVLAISIIVFIVKVTFFLSSARSHPYTVFYGARMQTCH